VLPLDELQQLPAPELIRWAAETFGLSLALSTSFQNEGMAILDMAVRVFPALPVFTLDTGRLPQETYDFIETVRQHYGIVVERVQPDAGEVAGMVTRYGPDLFYEDVALRTLCCHVRKVRPLERKLKEYRAWMVGLRRGQSESREAVEKIAPVGERFKLSPLADWTKTQVDEYLTRNGVPRHPLYAKGYTSIGCAPCTRATQPGEDERAGRWWWEEGAPKECGLHFTPDGRAVRKLDVLLREIVPA
jgi:phosphoadenosine phosphosulfate reductase